jgi:hypothetical protein
MASFFMVVFLHPAEKPVVLAWSQPSRAGPNVKASKGLSAPAVSVTDCADDVNPQKGIWFVTAALAQRAAALLREPPVALAQLPVTIGLDGFVDSILRAVDKRESAERFTAIETIGQLAERLQRAAGRSTNLELWLERVKLGGNGPIMANALATLGVPTTYIGNVGYPHLHPAFEELARRATVISVAEPALTDAVEFNDGKLMLGKRKSLHDVTWENLVARVGRDRLQQLWSQSALIGLQNWTMVPFMSAIWRQVLAQLCPPLPAAPRRRVFFDLADPESRSAADIREALELIGRFQRYFETDLGLNEKEAFHVGEVLGYRGATAGEAAVQEVAAFIHRQLGIAGVVVHPRAYAVAADRQGVVRVDGPFVERPLISTGAGDHFNAGFCLGKLLGADAATALQIGVATSGYYVRTARSPTAAELADFLQTL